MVTQQKTISSELPPLLPGFSVPTCTVRTIARTLNTPYQRHYGGLGNPSTTYPVSAFITHLLYLQGTLVPVDVKAITVSLSWLPPN